MLARAVCWAMVLAGLTLPPLFSFNQAALGQGKKSLEPRTAKEVQTRLKEILTPPKDAPSDEASQALRRLKAYRYLAEVPYEDLSLDPEYTKFAVAGAKLCERLNRLDHAPKRPEDMPEDEFKIAYIGTSRSSLAGGLKTLSEAVDGWMFDSDEYNIEHLGHRRWCLFPQMQKTGFGRAGIFSAMYTFDRSRKKAFDHEFVCWPARGPMPVGFFGPKHAWCVSPNPERYKPVKEAAAKVYRAGADGDKEGEPLKLDHASVNMVPFGTPYCIVFRPEKAEIVDGARYVVEIEGLKPLRPGTAATIRYPVAFFK